MVCSWAEDVESVQQNCYTGQHYPVGELRAPFIPFFLKMYHLLEIPTGPMDRKTPVPIQILREFVCQRLRIARMDFDARVRAMCEQGPEEFILSRPGGNHRKTIVRMKGRHRSAGTRTLQRNFHSTPPLSLLDAEQEHNVKEEFMMKGEWKHNIVFLCLILTAGIFMSTVAGAADTNTQPQCTSSADAPAIMHNRAACHAECVSVWCHPGSRFYDYCKFRCYLYCPLW